MILAHSSSSLSWLSPFLLPYAACALSPGITEKKLSRPVCHVSFKDFDSSSSGRSESEATAELTPLGTPEDRGGYIDISEPEWLV